MFCIKYDMWIINKYSLNRLLITFDILFIFCILTLITHNGYVVANAKDIHDGNTTNERCRAMNPSFNEYDITFTTEKVMKEYIVTFRNYHSVETRKNFLRSAFQSAKILQWRILPRSNASNAYPSDFDVVKVHENFNSTHLDILKKHESIKNVTPHRIIRRKLTYRHIDETNESGNFYSGGRRLLRALPKQITTLLRADALWKVGISGDGVKVAIFDTGLSRNHPHFKRVKERTNWTNEKSFDDGVSHGTFVAGIIASSKECLGFAPDAELHIYRVFTNSQVSYTSWFLDAFNHAIMKKINVLNLSIGGPDFLDSPFVEKIWELSANKVIMVSAIGNDGPLYGTLNNPGDQSDVVGVGSINYEDSVTKFSSRGMTTWEVPRGYGRLKPDIVTYGSQVSGSNVRGGCRSLSGTSVASPVAAGAIALIISGVMNTYDIVNPSSVKQVLLEGANPLSDSNMFEQGHGKLNILRSMELLSTYIPKVTLSPAYLDFSESYMWPYSSQPLFFGAAPTIVNVTILNGISVTGSIVETPTWHPYSKFHGHVMNVSIVVSKILWPWSGWMAIYIVVNEKGSNYEGPANGYIELKVQSESPLGGGREPINSTLHFPISVKIIPRPPRHKRILWDQYHSLHYPSGYLPRDNLKMKIDPLDWRGDHVHTNFRDMYIHLRNSGYYIDILRETFDCFNASNYGTLLIVDPEEEYFDEEIRKLYDDVLINGLSVIVFADWYNTTVMKAMKFHDKNTRQWWIPDTGGANVPALNELLAPYDIAFGDFVAEGHYTMGDHSMYYASGATLTRFPNTPESILIGTELHDQGFEIIKNSKDHNNMRTYAVPILGLIDAQHSAHRDVTPLLMPRYYEETEEVEDEKKKYEHTMNGHSADFVDVHSIDANSILQKRILLDNRSSDNNGQHGQYDNINSTRLDVDQIDEIGGHRFRSIQGRVAVFGDSNCLDSTLMEKPCYWLLDALLEFTMNAHLSTLLKDLKEKSTVIIDNERAPVMPMRLPTTNLHSYSKVLEADDRYTKRKIEKCEHLNWATVIVNHTNIKSVLRKKNNNNNNDNNDDNNDDIERRFLRKLENEKIGELSQADIGRHNPNGDKFYEEKKSWHGQRSRDNNYMARLKDGESFGYSVVFIVMLSLITVNLCIFLNWFKRQRYKRISLWRI